MDTGTARTYISQVWDNSITPFLSEFIRIPSTSPHVDPDWAKNGFLAQALDLAQRWCTAHAPMNAQIRLVRLAGRTPILAVEVPGTAPGNILLYGHVDKQPGMEGWSDGFDPWTPILRDGKLYGRGVADNGYALFTFLTALNLLQRHSIPHPRTYMIIECCGKSGSYDLPAYLDHLKHEIGTPDLVVSLDSRAGNYEQLWLTTSLRGMVSGTLRVDVLKHSVYSGDASGIVPSSFRILRRILDRIETPETGTILLKSVNVDVPRQRSAQAKAAAAILGTSVRDRFSYVDGMGPVDEDRAELLLNRSWRPALSYTGIDGVPDIAGSRPVIRPSTSLQLSLRTPPTVDVQAAYAELKSVLERDPPYGAHVQFEGSAAKGWHAPMMRPWLHGALESASKDWFGRPAMYLGDGGTMASVPMLGRRFPQAQVVITGVLGPNSNAHGPNEYLHLDMAKNLTGCVAQLIHRQGEQAGIDAQRAAPA